ncbi:glycosyltransferase family 2 protein [Paenibacillus sp. PDC88]|uniref:glycosyltransferase family 2 protein n=1 Tax=Paenibacillus sp. PDC88 TaxID=1884375 RepID=UPI000898E123|nr:glycosyltransferase family 2 protein [Paenibacillus sp. PDC88]SDX31420.1 Glycosyltransferase, GT2 family [Paenibacillus sp. PDC88]
MIDVIIPVYSGFHETEECLVSVLEKINKIPFRVIIINDFTPDQRINDLLNSICDNRVTIINNAKNLGFVKSVNLGMKQSLQNDVIILNADTIVTNYWIDKLHNAAYMQDKIGTVTSLTNNGTISSVPNFNEDNRLPDGYTVEGFSQLIERISIKKYPIIPTGVGHAMFIKRKVLEEVGLFDEETFGKGYGEEVDFSYRAAKKGYLNILADDTFIFHYGSTSFKEEKRLLIENNRKIIIKRHFVSQIKTKLFVLFNREVRMICENITNEIKRESTM